MNQPTFQGIVPPLVTPLDDQRQLDLAGLERLVERMIAAPVHGVFVLGTTGEGPSLPQNLQHQVVSAVCDQVSGRLPVFVGVTNTVAAYSVEIAEAAYAAGATALVLAPPYYLPMTQQELVDYTERLVAQLPLPVMLYNMPGCCKTWFDVDAVRQLSQLPQVAGLKDSSGDLNYLQRVIQQVRSRPDFSLFVGPEEILVKAMRLGVHGGVHGGANMFPRLYVEMYRAAAEARWADADRWQEVVLRVGGTIYTASEGPSRIIKGIKTVLELIGICGDQMAEPFDRHTAEGRRRVEAAFHQVAAELGELATVDALDPARD